MAKGIAEINWSDSDELQIQKTNANFRTVASPRFVMQQLNDAENQRELREFWASINEQYIHGGGGDGIADYIVASGVDETTYSGVTVSWQWVIWNSGLAECTGVTKDPLSLSASTQWGNVYHSLGVGRAAYPEDFFDTVFKATLDWVNVDNDGWMSIHRAGTNEYTPSGDLIRPNTNTIQGHIQYYAKGTISADFPYNPGVSYPPDGDNLYYGTEP